MDKHARIHLERLVALLDSQLASPSATSPLDNLQHTRLDTTATHARQLLDLAFADQPDQASSSRGPSRNSLLDLDQRLTRAEKTLASRAPSPPTAPQDANEDPLLALLPLSVPALPVLSSSPSSSSAAASEAGDPYPPPLPPSASAVRGAFALASSASAAGASRPPVSRPATPSSPPPRPSTPSSPVKSDRPASPFGIRQRQTGKEDGKEAVPPWLAAKRARDAERKRAEEKGLEAEKGIPEAATSGSASGAKGKGKEKATSAVDDLLPASQGPAGADLLSHHHSLQNELMDSLTSLSSALKSNTVAFSENLAKDKEVLERAQEKLGANSTGMEQNQGKLKQVRGRTRGTTCWTVGAVVAVVVAWVMMFGLMRVVPK
ncbi:hypothetical protein JCM8097_004755 [Rhodosporidiobolus ruineniae]